MTTYSILFVAFAILLFVLQTVHLVAFAFAALLFSTFDVMGYHFILTKKEKIVWKKSAWQLVFYRIVQTTFQALVTVFLWVYASPATAIAFVFVHLAGFHDLLYYLLLKQSFLRFKKGEMTWVSWSYLGLYRKYIRRTNGSMSGVEFLIQAVIGFIIAVLIIVFTS